MNRLIKKSLICAVLATSLSPLMANEGSQSLYEILSTPERPAIKVEGQLGMSYWDFDKKNLQVVRDQIILKFKVDINGNMQLIGHAFTGSHYKGAMNHLVEVDGQTTTDQEFALRRLYLSAKVADNTTMEVGALAPDGMTGLTGLSSNGWVDGGRLIFELKSGEKIELTAGNIGDPTEVSTFDRQDDFEFNYYEVRLSGKLLDKIAYQASYEQLNDTDYVRLVAKKDIETIANQVVTVIGEGMMNIENRDVKARLGISTDVARLFSETGKGLIVYADYLYTDDEIGIRNKYVHLDGLATGTGSSYRLGIKGMISKKKKLGWFANYEQNVATREYVFRSGVNMKF
jgi:hypothetical protein